MRTITQRKSMLYTNPIAQQLRDARAIYIRHYQYNHTQYRKLVLKFWSDECFRLRRELEAML